MLATIPSATSSIQALSEYANPWFTELLPWILIGVGIFMAVALVNWIKDFFLMKFDTDYRMDAYRDEARWKIEANKQIDKDWKLWRDSHK